MKRVVSFKIAKAIKEAGYPQEWYDTDYYYDVIGELKRCDNYEGNNLEDIMFYQRNAIPAPYATEVWLWLWKEKKKYIDVIFSEDEDGWTFSQNPSPLDCGLYSDPEEAIIAAIEYLVENDLIK